MEGIGVFNKFDGIPLEDLANPKSTKLSPFSNKKLQDNGNIGGCHHCGASTPGRKSGNWTKDHIPPSQLVDSGTANIKDQKFYPQCRSCQLSQGGLMSQRYRKK